jgi:hypothetical protein
MSYFPIDFISYDQMSSNKIGPLNRLCAPSFDTVENTARLVLEEPKLKPKHQIHTEY